jgi:transposase
MIVQSRKQYTAEFKAQILELADHGRPVSELSQEFEVSAGLIHTWRRKASKQSQIGSGGAGAVGDQDVADELRLLRGQVADLQLENDILKKAAVILGTKPQPKSGR